MPPPWSTSPRISDDAPPPSKKPASPPSPSTSAENVSTYLEQVNWEAARGRNARRVSDNNVGRGCTCLSAGHMHKRSTYPSEPLSSVKSGVSTPSTQVQPPIHKPRPANSAHELGGTVAPHNTTARGVESAGGTAWGCTAREEPPHAHAGVADRPFPALATANTATSRPAAATYQHLPHRSLRPTWQRRVPIRRIHTDYRRVRSKEVASTLGSGSYGARDSEIPVQRPWKSTSSGSSGALRWVCAAKFIEKIM